MICRFITSLKSTILRPRSSGSFKYIRRACICIRVTRTYNCIFSVYTNTRTKSVTSNTFSSREFSLLGPCCISSFVYINLTIWVISYYYIITVNVNPRTFTCYFLLLCPCITSCTFVYIDVNIYIRSTNNRIITRNTNAITIPFTTGTISLNYIFFRALCSTLCTRLFGYIYARSRVITSSCRCINLPEPTIK